MAENSKIEWTDHTFNPWIGCTKVSPGCDHCYAEQRMDKRLHVVNWGTNAPRKRTSVANWREPIRWNAAHEKFFAEHGRRQRVFCASLADVFDNEVPAQWRFDLLKLIEQTPNLDWLLLTKRIGNAAEMLEKAVRAINHGRWGWSDNVFPNAWIGATIINREEMLRDAPKLKMVPARVRFWSVEPMLGDLGDIPADLMPDWIIAGGESGPDARIMHPAWPRRLRDQCETADVPFLFKQHGEWAPGSGGFGTGRLITAAIAFDGRVAKGGFHLNDYPQNATAEDGWAMVHRAGKKAAGRLLDDVEWNEFPEVRQ